MDNQQLKLVSYLGIGFTFWIAALSPFLNGTKIAFYVLSIAAISKAIHLSGNLQEHEKRQRVKILIHNELHEEEILLHLQAQKNKLQQRYFPEISDGKSDPEVVEQLEHLLEHESSDHPEDLQISTYGIEAIRHLVEIKGESFVIQTVLGFQGRKYQQGKQILSEILSQNPMQ